MNLCKAQHDVMEIMDYTNNKATQKTDFVWVPYVKMGLLENQHSIFNIKDIFPKSTGYPMNWTNMMSSKRQDYALKNFSFYKRFILNR